MRLRRVSNSPWRESEETSECSFGPIDLRPQRSIVILILFLLMFLLFFFLFLLGFSSSVFSSSPVSSWTPYGPFDNPASGGVGSVNSIAASAGFSTFFIGGNNGGVWRTDDSFRNSPYPDSSYPHWTALTDENLCNSVGHVSVSQEDPLFLAYVCGGVSSYGKMSGPLIGIYVSHDGGLSWFQPAQGDSTAGYDFTHIVLTGSPTTNNGTIVASAKGLLVSSNGQWNLTTEKGGIFYSTDSGKTFKLSEDSLVLFKSIRDLKFDSSSPKAQSVLALTFTGELLSSGDFGKSWAKIPLPAIQVNPAVGPITNAKLASRGFSHAVDGVSSMTAIILCDGNQNGVIFWSANGLSNFQQFAIPSDVADYTGIWFFAIELDAFIPHRVYIAGGVDSIYMGDLIKQSWVALGSKLPHADHRSLLMNPLSFSLLITTDGGVWSYDLSAGLTNGTWFPQNGDLQITEFDSLAFDPATFTLASGAQDNGCFMTYQSTLPFSYERYLNLPSGDGQTVGFIPLNSETSYLLYAGQNLAPLFSSSWNGTFFSPSQTVNVQNFSQFAPFYSHIAINSIVPTLVLTCTDGDGFSGTCFSLDFLGQPGNLNPTITAVVKNFSPSDYIFGGTRNGVKDPEVIFGIASNQRVFAADSHSSNFYPSNQGFELRNWIGINFEGQKVMYQMRLAMNPSNYYEIVATGAVDVYRTKDFGASFQSISGNLYAVIQKVKGNFFPDPIIWGSAFVPLQNNRWAIVIGTALGIYAARNDQAEFEWFLVGSGYPNVVTNTLLYDNSTDVLISASTGRGWWILQTASEVIEAAINQSK